MSDAAASCTVPCQSLPTALGALLLPCRPTRQQLLPPCRAQWGTLPHLTLPVLMSCRALRLPRQVLGDTK